MPLWQWDQEAFRAIHVGMRREWLDPFFVAVTYTGLGYAQSAWLLLANRRHRLSPVLFSVAVAAAVLVIPIVEAVQNKASIQHQLLGLVGSFVGLALMLMLSRPIAACALAALVFSGALRLLVKSFVPRERPSNLDFAQPLENVFGASSFPSGHATTTFAIAAVACWCLAKTEDAWIAWAIGIWSVLVGVSRVYVGVHYPLDVLGAAMLGIAGGSLCYRYWLARGWLVKTEDSTD